MSDKKKDQIIDQIQKQVEKLREQSEAPESGFEERRSGSLNREGQQKTHKTSQKGVDTLKP